MKILFVLPEYYPHSGGGISTYYIQYIKALKTQASEIKVIVGSGYTQSDDVFDIEGIRVEYLRPELYTIYKGKFSKYDLMPDFRNNIAAAWAMWEQANEGKGYDIIECTDFGLGFIPWILKKVAPVVTRLHGSSGQIDLYETLNKTGVTADLFRQAELLLLKDSDALISHSTSNKIFWSNLLPKKEINVIYPIFTIDEIPLPLHQKEDYGIVCGRVQQWKGPDILCKAIEVLEKKVTINWYGRDTPFDSKINKTAQLKRDFPEIWDKVILHRQPLPNSEIIQFQKRAKFAVVPSIWDMFNFTALEYLNVGTALICSDGAGAAELIVDGVNGFKYKKDDYKSLANCIKRLLELDSKEYQKLIENGRNTLLNELNSDRIISANIKLYNEVLTSRSVSPSNVFVEETFTPKTEKGAIDITLSFITLRTLGRHIINRLIKKLWVL